MLDQSIVKPGEFNYAWTSQQLASGQQASVAQVDYGLTEHLSTSLGLVSKPSALNQATGNSGYTLLGLRGHAAGMIASMQLVSSAQGGLLGELNLKSRLAGFSVDLRHIQRDARFASDFYTSGAEGVRVRDAVTVMGSVRANGLPHVAVAVEAAHEAMGNATGNDSLSARLSSNVMGTAISNGWRWQSVVGQEMLDGNVQLSRRVFNVGLNAQADFGMQPRSNLRTVALTADHNLNEKWRVNAGVLFNRLSHSTQLSGGVSRNFGGFALALNGGYSSQRELVVGLQLFMALGRDPRSGKWFAEPLPLAGSGAVSVQAFVDKNMNGVRDRGEEPVPHAGFVLNHGGRHPAPHRRPGPGAHQPLANGRYADIALDPSTLEDPQWKPMQPGVRVLPRPGLVQTLDFPVVYTAEVEGTIYISDRAGQRRGIGDVQLELLDAKGEVLASTRSTADGYYLLHQVLPGTATLRVVPEQARKLGLRGQLAKIVKVPADGDFLAGQDLVLQIKRP